MRSRNDSIKSLVIFQFLASTALSMLEEDRSDEITALLKVVEARKGMEKHLPVALLRSLSYRHSGARVTSDESIRTEMATLEESGRQYALDWALYEILRDWLPQAGSN